MNRRRLEFLFVYTLVVIALPRAISGSELATRSEDQITMADTEKMETKWNFSYVLKSVTTKPCILADMNITIKVPYKTKEGKIDYILLKVPKDNVTIDGHCSVVISHMKITWKDNEIKADDKENSIKFTFINDHTNFSLYSIDLNIYRDEKNFVNATDKNQPFRATSDDLRLFVASVKNGIHKCNETEQKVGEGFVLMNNVSLIAFNRDGDLSSRKEIECSKEEEKKKTFPYVSKNANNDICTMARMSISVTVPYKTKKSGTKIATINVPTQVNVDGGCHGTAGLMTLTWPVPSVNSLADTSKKQNKISFLLVKKEKTSEIYDIRVEIFTDEKHFEDVESVGEPILIDTGFDASLFPAPVKNGIHSCPNETKFTSTNGNITISDVLFVAFDDEKDFASKKVIDCRGVFFEDDFKYIIKENTGTPCTLANMSITATVQMKDKNVTLNVPSNATATGICANKYSQMTLSWLIDNVTSNITFYIGQNKTHFFVSQIAASIYLESKVISGTSYNGIDLFSAAATNGIYRCQNSNSEIELDDIRLTITDVTFVAFCTEQNIFSANVTECPKLDPIIPETSTKPTPEPKPTPKPKPTSEPEPTPKPTSEPEPKPEPKPNVTDYNYFVMDSTSNVVCIAANMSISIEITYKTTEDKDEKGTLSVPINANATGKCGDKLSTMELHWSVESKENNATNAVAMNFEKDDSNYFIRSMNLSIYLDEHNFPKHKNDTEQRHVEGLNEFSTPLNNVYKCARNTSLTAKDAKIVIANVTMIAFNTNVNITSKSVDCVNDDDTSGSDAGAIVGGIIGGLIVLIGIIFLVILCRRRRGY